MSRSAKYSWRRFSLRTLMLLIWIVALWCGWVVHEARFYRQQHAYIQDLQVRFPNVVSVKPVANEWFWRPFAGDAAITVRRAALSEYRFEQKRYVLTDEDLKWSKDWTSIEGLSLGGPAITDESIEFLARFSELKELGLENTAITDAGTASIAPLKGLHSLAIYTIRERAFPSETGITDAALQNLVVGKDLRELSLTAPISDDGLLLIAESCPNLEKLQLFEARITGEGLQYVPQLTKLRELWISDNTLIDDAAIIQIAAWPTSKLLLWLQRTGVTEGGATALVNAAPGVRVRLQNDEHRQTYRAK